MNDVSMSQGLGNRPVERPQMGKSAEAAGQRARAVVEEARASGADLPKNAQGIAASGLARGATAESLFAALVNAPVGEPDSPVTGEGGDTAPVDGAGGDGVEVPVSGGDDGGGSPDEETVMTPDVAIGGADDSGEEAVMTVTEALPSILIDAEAMTEPEERAGAI